MIEYATISKIGKRKTNEDTVKVFVNQPLSTYGFVLADGLGGQGHGDIASNFACECVGAAIENTGSFEDDFIDRCFDTVQEMLVEEKKLKDLPSIMTTLVVLLITEKTARWGHIGDSRLYHFRDGRQLSRTVDHSVPQMLALSGQIKEREIRHHPSQNILLHALGSNWNAPEYDIDQRDMRIIKGDVFLLCSDGFWEWIEEKDIIKILKKDLSAYEALRKMTAEVEANATGKNMDNYSAILVFVK